MQTENRQLTPLEQAVAAQRTVVDQLAHDHDAALQASHELGVKLVAAINNLNDLRRQQAEL